MKKITQRLVSTLLLASMLFTNTFTGNVLAASDTAEDGVTVSADTFEMQSGTMYIKPVIENNANSERISYDKIGSTVNIDFYLKQNPGFASATFFVKYNPDVIKAKSGNIPKAQADLGSYVTYTYYYEALGVDIKSAFFANDKINAKIAYVPTADSTDYADVKADGVKTAADLGKVMLADIVPGSYVDANGYLKPVEGDGKLFSMTFDVVGSGDADLSIEVVKFGYPPMSMSAGANGEIIPTENYPNSIYVAKLVKGENLLEGLTDDYAAGKTIVSYNDIELKVPDSQAKGLKYTADAPAVMDFYGKEYDHHYQSGGTNTEATSLDGTLTGSFREALEIYAKEDGTIAIDCKVNDGKAVAIVRKADDGSYTSVELSAIADNTNAAASTFETLTADLKAGDKVFLIAKGTNVPIYSVIYSSGVERWEEVPDVDDVDFGDLTIPTKGVTYTADFAAMSNYEATQGMTLNGVKLCSGTMQVVASGSTQVRSDGHGATLNKGDKIKIAVVGNAKIELTTCNNGYGTWTLRDYTGKLIGTFAGKNTEAAGHESEIDGGETAQVINYEGDATVLTLRFDPDASGQTFVHKLSVTCPEDPKTESVDFDTAGTTCTNNTALGNDMYVSMHGTTSVASAAYSAIITPVYENKAEGSTKTYSGQNCLKFSNVNKKLLHLTFSGGRTARHHGLYLYGRYKIQDFRSCQCYFLFGRRSNGIYYRQQL